HKNNFDRHLVQTSRKRDSRAADVPTTHEIFDQYKVPANSRRVALAVLAAGDFGRPIIVTPGTPPERVKILRDAFVKSLNDPELLAEANKARMVVEQTSGTVLVTLV